MEGVNIIWSSQQFRDRCPLREDWFGTPYSTEGGFMNTHHLCSVHISVLFLRHTSSMEGHLEGLVKVLQFIVMSLFLAENFIFMNVFYSCWKKGLLSEILVFLLEHLIKLTHYVVCIILCVLQIQRFLTISTYHHQTLSLVGNLSLPPILLSSYCPSSDHQQLTSP